MPLLGCNLPEKREHPQHVRMGDQVGVKVVDLRKGHLRHDVLMTSELTEILEDARLEQLLCVGLLRVVDVDLRLDDRHEASREDLVDELELLSNDRVNAG